MRKMTFRLHRNNLKNWKFDKGISQNCMEKSHCLFAKCLLYVQVLRKKAQIYRNELKNRDFGEKVSQNLCVRANGHCPRARDE